MTQGIYPPMFHYLRQYGIYVFRFFKNYDWKYVIIDDFLPATNYRSSGWSLLFARCRNKSEFWVPLIEKAYAKMHKKYKYIVGG